MKKYLIEGHHDCSCLTHDEPDRYVDLGEYVLHNICKYSVWVLVSPILLITICAMIPIAFIEYKNFPKEFQEIIDRFNKK